MGDESEVLKELQRDPNWPAELTGPAKRAAALGWLGVARDRAAAGSVSGSQPSSTSSSAMIPAQVPPHFSELPNWDATFYARLKQELLSVLGEEDSSFRLYGDD